MKKRIPLIIFALSFGLFEQVLTSCILSIPETKAQIIIKKGDITKSNVDIIVNAANQELAGGAGVCGAIFTAAGWDQLQASCNRYPEKNGVRCPTGEARVTDSFDLKKQGIKYIIHSVGPDCRIIKDQVLQNELLKNAYINSLKLAETLSVSSIAFPFISSAIYAFPKDRAAHIAVQSVYQYLKENKNSNIESIYFVLFSQDDFDLFCKTVTAITQEKKDSSNLEQSFIIKAKKFLKNLFE